jgi:hypothetical protein
MERPYNDSYVKETTVILAADGFYALFSAPSTAPEPKPGNY